MTGDPWKYPAARRFIDEVLRDMKPKLESSAVAVSIVPNDREGDVKFWVELGASIMMDKPIIALAIGEQDIPPKLELVADEIVRVDSSEDLKDPRTSGAVAEALKRVMTRRGLADD